MNYQPPLPFDASLRHLQLMMTRLDLLVHREVRRVQQVNQANSEAFNGQFISDAEAEALLKKPFGSHRRLLDEQNEARQTAVYQKAWSQANEQVAAFLQRLPDGEQPRLAHLADAFGLSDFEVDALLICLAPALDTRYERLYGYLLDDATRKRPTVNLILDLLAGTDPRRLLMLPAFADDAPLFRTGFVETVAELGQIQPTLLNQALQPDPALVSWLLGEFRPHAHLRDHSRVWPLAATNIEHDLLIAGERLESLLMATAQFPVLVFNGRDRAAQRAAGRLLAYQMKRPLLHIDLAPLLKADLPAPRAVQLALRDARLANALPYLDGWDACLEEDAPPNSLLQEILKYPDFVILAGQKAWRPRQREQQRHLLWVDFPLPAYTQRQQLWHQFLGEAASAIDVSKLAGQFTLTTGQIQDIVASAWDTAVQHGRPLNDEDLFASARAHSSSRLAALARKITPRYDWEDLILPDDQVGILREIISTLLSRPFVLEEWGVGAKLVSSAGITVLFAGPPGTGKTMAAEVIARELGLDLYKIDLSSVISKYIGETEKNLEKIFNEAESSNAVLFFDEADSIFGKRSEVRDAHDRYANIEVSYLLQRMESYDGVTILATNLRANLDEAFMRRIQFAIDFPFPEMEDRLRIWQTLMPADVPQAADLDLERMARQFKMAGGNIRNVIVSATYLAAANGRQINMENLMHGTRRELQKMGRLVNEEDLLLE
jgi:hypothetical protein